MNNNSIEYCKSTKAKLTRLYFVRISIFIYKKKKHQNCFHYFEIIYQGRDFLIKGCLYQRNRLYGCYIDSIKGFNHKVLMVKVKCQKTFSNGKLFL